MKRATRWCLMCLVFSVTVVSVDASAGAGKRRVYEGTLSNGYPMGIKLVLREDRSPALREVGSSAPTSPARTAPFKLVHRLRLGGGTPALPSHTLDLDLVDSSMAIHIHGVMQAVQG